jgi:hypothetical protein
MGEKKIHISAFGHPGQVFLVFINENKLIIRRFHEMPRRYLCGKKKFMDRNRRKKEKVRGAGRIGNQIM